MGTKLANKKEILSSFRNINNIGNNNINKKNRISFLSSNILSSLGQKSYTYSIISPKKVDDKKNNRGTETSKIKRTQISSKQSSLSISKKGSREKRQIHLNQDPIDMNDIQNIPTIGLYKNGNEKIDSDLSSKDFLSNSPTGAYTTARTYKQKSIFEYHNHIQRLASSAKLLGSCEKEFTDVDKLNLKLSETLHFAMTDYLTNILPNLNQGYSGNEEVRYFYSQRAPKSVLIFF